MTLEATALPSALLSIYLTTFSKSLLDSLGMYLSAIFATSALTSDELGSTFLIYLAMSSWTECSLDIDGFAMGAGEGLACSGLFYATALSAAALAVATLSFAAFLFAAS